MDLGHKSISQGKNQDVDNIFVIFDAHSVSNLSALILGSGSDLSKQVLLWL